MQCSGIWTPIAAACKSPHVAGPSSPFRAKPKETRFDGFRLAATQSPEMWERTRETQRLDRSLQARSDKRELAMKSLLAIVFLLTQVAIGQEIGSKTLQAADRQSESGVAIMHDGRKACITKERFADILRQIQRQLAPDSGDSPQVVAICASKAMAKFRRLPADRIFVELIADDLGTFYYAWVPEDVTDIYLANEAVIILNRHLNLHLSEQEIVQVAGRALAVARATVDANAFVPRKGNPR